MLETGEKYTDEKSSSQKENKKFLKSKAGLDNL